MFYVFRRYFVHTRCLCFLQPIFIISRSASPDFMLKMKYSKFQKHEKRPHCTARREGSPAHPLLLSPLAGIPPSSTWAFGLRSAGLGGRTQCASHPRPTETRARPRGSAHTGGCLSFGRLASFFAICLVGTFSAKPRFLRSPRGD